MSCGMNSSPRSVSSSSQKAMTAMVFLGKLLGGGLAVGGEDAGEFRDEGGVERALAE